VKNTCLCRQAGTTAAGWEGLSLNDNTNAGKKMRKYSLNSGKLKNSPAKKRK
jgi:hypothetical protein